MDDARSWIIEYLLRPVHLLDTAFVDDGDPVCDLLGPEEVMDDKNRGHPQFLEETSALL